MSRTDRSICAVGMKFAFYKAPGSLLDKLIRWWMRGTYSHVEAVLRDNGDGTYLVASSVPGTGVRIANIALPMSDYDIIDGPGSALIAHAWFLKRVGNPYDYFGLLGFVFRPATSDDRGKYWCSEACLQAIGFPGAWRFDPNAMFDLIKYEGVRTV